MDNLVAALKSVLGPKGALEGDDIGERYRSDMLGLRCGDPALVLRPASTGEVSRVLALCHAASRPVVPQGGMTGLVDAATPMDGELVLTLERMRAIIELDGDAATLAVEAGVPLQTVQEHADAHGFLFPLDLGARGSCTIGGNLSTNAGGNRVLRYGMARDSVLGLEAVLADGTVIDGLHKMTKNNAGYDLKHLFIGAEGTLGVITRAVLKLWPKPRSQSVAFCSLTGFEAATRFLHHCNRHLGGTLSAFEAVWPAAYDLALDAIPAIKAPLPAGDPFYVLVESMGGDPETDAARFEAALQGGIEAGWLNDAVIAKSQAEIGGIWAVRDAIPEAVAKMGPTLHYDVSVPLGDMGRLADNVARQVAARWDDTRLIFFGHIGDSNLHIVCRIGDSGRQFHDQVDALVYDQTAAVQGSISAEHGIGLAKRPYLGKTRRPAEIALMRTLKGALDPRNILSPGRVFELAPRDPE